MTDHSFESLESDLEPWAGVGDGPAGVRGVFLHVTKACNLNCQYCYFSARKPMPGEMTIDEFESLWPQLVALGPAQVVFTGGEPLLRPDLLELLRGLKDADPEHRVKRCLNTNGHLVSTEDRAGALVGLADEVRVSLDALRERNDALRGRGNFDAALRSIDCLSAVGFEPKVLVTVTAGAVGDLEELLVLLARRGVTRVNLNGFRPVGRGAGRWDWRAAETEVVAAVARAWRRCHPDQPRPILGNTSSPPQAQRNCGVGRFLNIMPDGDVFPCHVLTQLEFRLGNVKEQRLAEVCRAGGLLSRLAGLDFRQLAGADARLAELTRTGACLGNVYSKMAESAVWRRRLSLPVLG